jgi:hypothetical protein
VMDDARKPTEELLDWHITYKYTYQLTYATVSAFSFSRWARSQCPQAIFYVSN